MKILVAGKGFIGSETGKALEKEGHNIKYLDRKNADFEKDVTQKFELEEHFDVIIHSIGLAPGFFSAKDYYRLHVNGTRNIVDGINADKIIYLSALGAGDVDHSFFRTKREAERIIEKSGRDYTILRPSTVYGEGNKLLELIKKTGFTRLFPNIKTRTQPIHRKDLVEVVSEIVELQDNIIMDIAGKKQVSIGGLAKHLYAQEGYKCFLIPVPQFLIELGLVGLSFLPPPFQKENIKILRAENTTEENGAEQFIDLRDIF
jgi:NADH dehydrogenase